MTTADEVFAKARAINKLYSEQRAATPDEINSTRKQMGPISRFRSRKEKNWTTVATDDGYKATVRGKDSWTGIGMPSSSYRQVKKPGTGQLL